MDGERELRAAESSPDAPVCPSCGLLWPHDACRLRSGDAFWREYLRACGWSELPDGSLVDAPTCVGLGTALAIELGAGPLDPSEAATLAAHASALLAKGDAHGSAATWAALAKLHPEWVPR